MTKRQGVFVREFVNNPKQTATDAAMVAYNVSNRGNAAKLAHNTLKSPAVKMALQQHSGLAEEAVVAAITDWGKADAPRKREIATQNAQWLHDKVWGKATARVEIHSEVFNVNIDLTGQGEAPPEDDKILDLTED